MMRIPHRKFRPAACLIAALAFLTGCGGEQRPPMDQLDSRDRGLQSKDVIQASDRLAMDLLSLPQLNASREQWTVVVDRVEDNTRDNLFQGDYNIFLQRLQTNLARQGHGRIALIENRSRFNDIRQREMENDQPEDFGQGEPGAINPEYALYAKAMDLPGRGTTYYNLQFGLVDFRTRRIVWTGDYEVRVSRD